MRGGSTTSEVTAALQQENSNCAFLQEVGATSGWAGIFIICPTYSEIAVFGQINATMDIVNANSEHLNVTSELKSSEDGIEARIAISNLHILYFLFRNVRCSVAIEMHRNSNFCYVNIFSEHKESLQRKDLKSTT